MREIDLFSFPRGSVLAPAGCGKTQLIADTLRHQDVAKPVLVLTHTNAGKGALEARMRRAAVPVHRFRVATIDSWAIRLASMFPQRSGVTAHVLNLENPNTDYDAIRNAIWGLLSLGHVNDAIRASYSALIVDEYQDCSTVQHNIVGWLANVLPTYVLGDPLQAIFNFREPTVRWTEDVQNLFPPIGELGNPWRWRNANAEALGQWLLDIRLALSAGAPIDLRGAPPQLRWIQLSNVPNETHRQRLEAARFAPADRSHTVLIIGDSRSPQSQRQFASQTPGATTVEAVDFKDLTAFGRRFDLQAANALESLLDFASDLMNNVGKAELLRRVGSLEKGSAKKAPSPTETAALAFKGAPGYRAAVHLIHMLEQGADTRVYRPEVTQVLKSAFEGAAAGDLTFYQAVVRARERTRHLARPTTRRAVGSTLLLKGLESDVAVILDPTTMNAQHLYVALTRGARQLVVCSQSPFLNPAG